MEDMMLCDPKKEAKIAEELFEASLQQWQRVLLATAEFFKTHGWCRGDIFDGISDYCAIGGMRMIAQGNLFNSFECHTRMGGAQDHFARYVGVGVGTWNDRKCKSKEQLIRELQYCALGGHEPSKL